MAQPPGGPFPLAQPPGRPRPRRGLVVGPGVAPSLADRGIAKGPVGVTGSAVLKGT